MDSGSKLWRGERRTKALLGLALTAGLALRIWWILSFGQTTNDTARVWRVREEPAGARCLRLDPYCKRRDAAAAADADPAAGVSAFFSAWLSVVRGGELQGRDADADGRRSLDVPAAGWVGGASVRTQSGRGGGVAGSAVSVYGELRGGAADGDADAVVHGGSVLWIGALEGTAWSKGCNTLSRDGRAGKSQFRGGS